MQGGWLVVLDRTTTASAVVEDSSKNALSGRRALFALLVAATMAAVLWLAFVAVPPHSAGGIAFLILFTITLPWSAVGLWNAVIGFLIMRLAKDPAAAVNPMADSIRGDEPITSSSAILMCIRNESPDQVIRNLAPLLEGLVQARVEHKFYV